MASTLETYLSKIKNERYAKDMRTDIIEAIRQASKMGPSSGGSGGSSEINYDELGSEIGYVPYIYANTYDGVLYDIDDFKVGDLGINPVYRKIGNLPLYLPNDERFRVVVDVTDNPRPGPHGLIEFKLNCNTKGDDYSYTISFDPENTSHYVYGPCTSFGEMESISIEETGNAINGSNDDYYGYEIKIELISPSKTNSKVRYLLGDKFLDASVQTNHDVAPDDPSNKSFIFKPFYNLVSGYKYYFNVSVTPSSGYTVENEEMAKLYLYKDGEDFTSGQYVVITDAAAQTIDFTSSGDWNKIRLEYLTAPSGIYNYDPLINIEGYPFAEDGESPSPSDYNISEHFNEIKNMGFITFFGRYSGSTYPTDSSFYNFVLYGQGSMYSEIYGTTDTDYHYGVFHRSTIGYGTISTIDYYKDWLTGETFVRYSLTSSPGTFSSWTKIDVPSNSIDWDQLSLDVANTITKKIEPHPVNGSISSVDALNVWYYAQQNEVYYLCLVAQAASYFGVPNRTLAEVKLDFASSVEDEGIDIMRRYMTFPEYSGVKWVQSVTEVGDQHSRIFSAGDWEKADNYTFGKKSIYSFSIDAAGNMIKYLPVTTIGSSTFPDAYKLYVSEIVESITNGVIARSPNLTDIYVDNYAENIIIDPSIKSNPNITIHYRNEFNVQDFDTINIWRLQNEVKNSKPKLSFSMDSNGNISAYSNSTIWAAGILAGSVKVYASSLVSSITDGFRSSSPNLTDIYVDNYEALITIDDTIKSNPNITIHYRNEFNILDLVIPNLVALNLA